MSQLMLLLKAKCAFCNSFKLSSLEKNRFTCKLLLLKYGLVDSVDEIDAITEDNHKSRALGKPHNASEDETASSDDGENLGLKHSRIEYVKQTVKRHGGARYLQSCDATKVAAVSERRRAIIKAFFQAGPSRGCKNCKGYLQGLCT